MSTTVSPSTNTNHGLDVGASMALINSQNTHTQHVTGSMAAMHATSMDAMKHAMAEMRASQQSSDRNYQQLAVSMQSQASSMMSNMSSIMNRMMEMMGPAMMAGMGGGFGNSLGLGGLGGSGVYL
jgi:hypothetical protein